MSRYKVEFEVPRALVDDDRWPEYEKAYFKLALNQMFQHGFVDHTDVWVSAELSEKNAECMILAYSGEVYI